MISIIHPSRGRPEKSFKTIMKWIKDCSSFNVEYIISIDYSDPLKDRYIDLYKESFELIINDNKSSVEAINAGAKVAKGEILMVISDDTDCFLGWNSYLFRDLDGQHDFILKTQDGIQPWMITMPVMDRTYYNRFGYIYYPEYKHMFCDTELTCVADITGRKITSNLLFKHNHYSVGGMAKDEVSARADATWAQGENLFLERHKRNFDLPPGNPIQDNGMINWLKKKQVA